MADNGQGAADAFVVARWRDYTNQRCAACRTEMQCRLIVGSALLTIFQLQAHVI